MGISMRRCRVAELAVILANTVLRVYRINDRISTTGNETLASTSWTVVVINALIGPSKAYTDLLFWLDDSADLAE
jgi:hypothetical protein